MLAARIGRSEHDDQAAPVGPAAIAAAAAALREPMRAIGMPAGRAVLLAVAAPRAQALLAAALPRGWPLAPAEPSLPAAAAARILARIDPALLVTDRPDSPLALAAGEAGIGVASLAGGPCDWRVTQGRPPAASRAYPEDLALLLETTGTSGEPKLVGLSRANLAASVAGIAATLGLGPADRTPSVMPLTHVHGLVAVLHGSLAAGGAVLPIPPRDPESFWRTLDRTRPTWLSMVPTLLQAILDAAPAVKPAALDGLRFVRTSSSGLPEPLRRRAEAYFDVPVLEAYGMTEACHQMASQRPGATPAGSVGPAGPGVEISIRAADGAALATGAVGEVCIRGPNVMRGYLHPPEANAGAFHPGAWFRTGDLGRLDAAGALWLAGRLKEQINRGGETLAPTEIEAALLAHPGVAEAVAFPLPHPSLGEEVAAVVVPRRGAVPPTVAEMLDLAAARLPFAQVPKTLFLAEALPRLPSGKISRIAIAAHYRAQAAGDAAAPAAAGAEVAWRARLRGHLATVLGLPEIGDGDSFFALGGTSLHAVQLMARIEAETGVVLPVSRLLTHPSVAALARLLADADATSSPPAAAPAVAGPFPVSAHIVALRVAERLDPQPGQNIQPLLLPLAPGIGPEDAAAAWDSVVAAQPLLRHGFDDAAPPRLAPLAEAEWPRLARIAVAASAEAVAADPLLRPEVAAFLAAPAPGLVHAAWIGAADGAAFLLVAAHAAIADGYGKALLPRLIDAALCGRPLPTPAADLPRLCGAVAALPPPVAQAEGLLHEDGPQHRDRQARTLERPLDAAGWAAIQAWARREGVTPFAAMLATFGHLLGRLAGAPVPVWVPRQRRRGAADFATIANATALVRWVPTAEAAQADLPAAARAAMATLFTAAEAGEDAHPDRDARACLLEIAEEGSEIEALHPGLALGGAVRAATPLPERHAEVDIKLLLLPPAPGGAAPGVARLVFAPARFSENRAAALLDAFLGLVGRAIAAPAATPLARLGLAAAHDRPLAWPRPDAAAPLGALAEPGIDDLAGLFDRILARAPEADAVLWPGGGRARFRDIDALARAVAGALAPPGARLPGQLVGFRIAAEGVAEDRVLFLAAQIACWRLGAALLPLGHQTPPAQARAMAETLGVRHLIDARGTLDAAPGWAVAVPRRRIEGNPDALLVSTEAPEAAPLGLPPGTAMVFATSGTTGMPKAIAESHATILALLRGLASLEGMPAASGLMGTNIGFDPVLSDVWIPWSHGRPVIVLPTERRTPAALAEARGLGARVLGLSPTVAAAALREEPGCLDGFDALLLTGEALPVPLAQALAQRAPRLAAFNLYGPTETTVWASAWRVEPWAERTVPVGRALPGYRILVADPATGQPLPPHWPGEVLIATPVASPGYLDRALTAARFVAVEGEAGGPFFRTGDHGWVDAEGRLRFVGRTDRQVQVRGVRIELDGIERVVGRVPGVAEAAALAFGAEGTAARLAVVVAAAPGAAADPAALQEAVLAACRAWLPRAAVPAEVVLVEAMPRGPSGKTAHAALRAMLEARAASARPAAGLRRPAPGSVGFRIAVLWAALLEAGGPEARPAIGLDDDFFALGATSLDALVLAERMERAFGVAVPSEQLFLHPTLAGQAALVTAAMRAARRAAPPKPALAGGGGPVQFRTVRGPRDGRAERGTVLTLPGIQGQSPFLGNLATQALADYRLVAVSVSVQGRSLLEAHQWLDVVRAIVAAIDAGAVPTPTALLGFSMGGWLAWIAERMRCAAGAPALPVISLDGSAMHARRPDLAERLQEVLPAPDALGPARLLLIHGAAEGRFRVGRDRPATWRQAGVEPACIPIRSVRHFDAVSRETMAAADPAMSRFILDPAGFAAPAAPIEPTGPGRMLCGMLEASHPPEADRLRALAESIGAANLDDTASTALLFLAMASGDRALALDIARRKSAEDPAHREAVFAEVAILAESGEVAAATARAEAWCQRRRRDAAMLARARERAGKVADRVAHWAEAPPMAVDSDAALGFAARFCAGG